MTKEKIETRVDSFVDEYGDTRYFVVAAVSELLPRNYSEISGDEADKDNEVVYEVNQCDEYDCNYADTVVKSLKLGFAICNPIDQFDVELGKKIAIGRARKNSEVALYATKPGYINSKLVNAFLEQESEYFKDNPGLRIAGYKRMR